jgi:hypothetical protein
LKAAGLDGFDIGLLNLHWEESRSGWGWNKQEKENPEKEVGALAVAWFNPALAMVER